MTTPTQFKMKCGCSISHKPGRCPPRSGNNRQARKAAERAEEARLQAGTDAPERGMPVHLPNDGKPESHG